MTSWQELSERRALRVRPFRGVHFAPAEQRAGLPMLRAQHFSSAERSDNIPYHVLDLLAPVFAGEAYTGARTVRERWDSWIGDEVLRRDAPSLYVYEQSNNSTSLLGLIGAVDLLPSGGDAFLEHEEVIEERVRTQETFEHTAHLQLEPILALHRTSPSLSEQLASIARSPALIEVVDTQETHHRLWRVDDPQRQQRLVSALPDEPALIADGHHRHAAWERTAELTSSEDPAHWAMSLLVDVEQTGLHLGAVHRVVQRIDIDQMLASGAVVPSELDGRHAAESYLRTGPAARCVIYARGRYYAATPAHPSEICAAPDLAVCHLHSHWLPQWGLGEPDVDYVHEIDEAIAFADHGAVAVLLPVTDLDLVWDAASNGRPLPRKATSFGPKPLIGIVLRGWDDAADSFS